MIEADNVNTKLRELRALRDDRAELDQRRKKMTEELEERNAELVEYFENNEIQQVRLEEAGLFYVSRTSYPQIEDMESVTDWLKERSDLDFMMSFNKQKFKSYYNEKVENNEELPPNVNQFIKSEIRMRRS